MPNQLIIFYVFEVNNFPVKTKASKLFICWVISGVICHAVLLSADFFQEKCLTFWIQIRPDVLSVLFWVTNCLKTDDKIRRMQAEFIVKYNIGL